jgi:uncharacterized short protein YbdD (DUF466 family)
MPAMKSKFSGHNVSGVMLVSVGGTIRVLKHFLHNAWYGIREWCGDSAYERYLHARNARSHDSSILTPAEFYVEQLNRRYSRPNRCC